MPTCILAEGYMSYCLILEDNLQNTDVLPLNLTARVNSLRGMAVSQMFWIRCASLQVHRTDQPIPASIGAGRAALLQLHS